MDSRTRAGWRRRVVGLVTAGLMGAVTVLAGASPANAAPAYTALGDSFTSGVGTRTYYSDGTSCQRSPYAYPVIDAQRLGATLTFAACSGARTYDVRDRQLGSLSSTTTYVTVQVGGNDAGFGPVIEQCAKPWPYTCWTEINNANSFIRNTLPGRLDELYGRIRTKAPNARVVVVGYPRIFNGEECNAVSRISPGEQSELNKTADLLSTTIKGRALTAAFLYVDAIPPFIGHAVCDDVEWINGASWPLSESYHPNRNGHVGYANLVEQRLRYGLAAADKSSAA
ncbi:MAG TPA: SGNH/GDSL hydrolase family protein [Micromonosporaceae bacterium]|nr:SGNH/GDSL hydrolase family protein [Micromonosporaceae bacterium]